jgi:uncharacterized delta-60 repeat protein
MKKLLALSATLFTACGDGNQVTPDASVTPDGAAADASVDAPSSFTPPTPVAVPISSTGTDQLLAVAPAPGGGFYGVGFHAPSFETTSDRELALVKLSATGALDTAFGGGDGIATLNAQVGGNGEVWRGVVVQPSGKIVVSGTVEDEVTATDRDIVLARFAADGTLDTTFGTAGTVRLALRTAVNGTMGLDSTWGLAVDAVGKLYVHAGKRAEGTDAGGDPFTDTDFAVIRLDVEGAIDTTFGIDGTFTLDIQRSSASVRGITVLADGAVLGYGYARSTSTGNTVQPVIYKLTTDGTLDASFASGGLFHEVVLATQTEVYGIAVQPDGTLVTAGYGRDDQDGTNDWVSLRLTADGVLDTTWANAGTYVLDPTGMNIADNCRNAIALPDGRTALIGNGGPASAGSDAYVVILDDTGKPDAGFGTGIMKFELGGSDALFGGAVALDGTRALFAGFKGGGATPSATSNDDAHVISLALE